MLRVLMLAAVLCGCAAKEPAPPPPAPAPPAMTTSEADAALHKVSRDQEAAILRGEKPARRQLPGSGM